MAIQDSYLQTGGPPKMAAYPWTEQSGFQGTNRTQDIFQESALPSQRQLTGRVADTSSRGLFMVNRTRARCQRAARNIWTRNFSLYAKTASRRRWPPS